MPEYIRIPVTVLIEKDSDIHKRLLRLAEKSGTTLKGEVDFLVAVGLNSHLRCNIKRMEAEYGIID